MKNFMLMAVMAAAFAACTGTTEEAVVEEVVVDSTALDTTVTEEVAVEGEEAAAE